MNELILFLELKNKVLIEYRKNYPYFQGNWRNFSSNDIRQLIDLIEIQLNERVSEKWIYTHLKPKTNDRLPRKDMLDIFSKFVGYSDWNEFIFKHQNKETNFRNSSKKYYKWIGFLIVILGLISAGVYLFPIQPKFNSKTISLKNEFTKAPVNLEEINIYTVKDSVEETVEVIDSKIEVSENDELIIIESPYFEKQEVQINESKSEILIKPEDYALVLKTFIDSDLKDWESRKEKLNKILADSLEVIVLTKENLGAEYLNKKEFSEKLIIPTSETRKMKIIHLETNEKKKITFIRVLQL